MTQEEIIAKKELLELQVTNIIFPAMIIKAMQERITELESMLTV